MARKAAAEDPGYALEIVREPGGALAIRVRGRVHFGNVEALRHEILAAVSGRVSGAVSPAGGAAGSGGAGRSGGSAGQVHGDVCTLSLEGVEAKDASTAGLLLRLPRDLQERGLTLDTARFDNTSRTLLSLVDPESLTDVPPPARRRKNFIEAQGDYLLDRTAEARGVLQFIGRVTLSLLLSFRHPGKIRWAEVAYLVQQTGAEALPIVALMSLLVGLVTAFSSAIQLRQFGADIFIADLIGIGMTREMGPLLAAILLTGRSGSAFAAEIGTMKISDEVDALTVMGIKPHDYLVTPRILAVMLALPLLTLFADIFGILGGILIAVSSLDVTPLAFLQELRKAIGVWDVFSGVLKAFVFGILVAGVGCYRGMDTRGGALGVGRSTTAAVVLGIFLIVVADSLFVVVFHYLHLG